MNKSSKDFALFPVYAVASADNILNKGSPFSNREVSFDGSDEEKEAPTDIIHISNYSPNTRKVSRGYIFDDVEAILQQPALNIVPSNVDDLGRESKEPQTTLLNDRVSREMSTSIATSSGNNVKEGYRNRVLSPTTLPIHDATDSNHTLADKKSAVNGNREDSEIRIMFSALRSHRNQIESDYATSQVSMS